VEESREVCRVIHEIGLKKDSSEDVGELERDEFDEEECDDERGEEGFEE